MMKQDGAGSSTVIATAFGDADLTARWNISLIAGPSDFVIRNVASGWYLYQASPTVVACKATLSSPVVNGEKWRFTTTNIVPS